jgi:hypothetical protein
MAHVAHFIMVAIALVLIILRTVTLGLDWRSARPWRKVIISTRVPGKV